MLYVADKDLRFYCSSRKRFIDYPKGTKFRFIRTIDKSAKVVAPGGLIGWLPVAYISRKCETPGAVYRTVAKPRGIGVAVELPFDSMLSEEESEILMEKMHDFMESLIAPLFCKTA